MYINSFVYIVLIINLFNRECYSINSESEDIKLEIKSTNKLEEPGDNEKFEREKDTVTEKLGFYDKPLSNISLDLINEIDTSLCSGNPQRLQEKAQYIIDKYIPALLKLKKFSRGVVTSVTLENGNLIVKNVKLLGQPLCSESGDGNRVYDFMVSFDDLTGFYDWKITNFFRYNYGESALITIRKLVAQLIFTENNNAINLKDVKIGTIDGLDVKVNIPEDILNSDIIKNFMQYVVSRITSMIANRSKDMIIRHMESILSNDIRHKLNEKSNINNKI